MNWPGGIESKYFLRSMDRNSKMRYNLESCMSTSWRLRENRTQAQLLLRASRQPEASHQLPSHWRLEEAFQDSKLCIPVACLLSLACLSLKLWVSAEPDWTYSQSQHNRLEPRPGKEAYHPKWHRSRSQEVKAEDLQIQRLCGLQSQGQPGWDPVSK